MLCIILCTEPFWCQNPFCIVQFKCNRSTSHLPFKVSIQAKIKKCDSVLYKFWLCAFEVHGFSISLLLVEN